MPTLKRFSEYRVLIYIDDHPPPHVHIIRNDGRDCIVEIETLQVIGKLAPREIRDALQWIASERGVLLDEWRRYQT